MNELCKQFGYKYFSVEYRKTSYMISTVRLYNYVTTKKTKYVWGYEYEL